MGSDAKRLEICEGCTVILIRQFGFATGALVLIAITAMNNLRQLLVQLATGVIIHDVTKALISGD